MQDSGIGIDSKRINDLFSPFTQLESGQKAAGTGLGLSISRSLAQLMGGDITVDSALGHGATFTVRIPLQVADDVSYSDYLRREYHGPQELAITLNNGPEADQLAELCGSLGIHSETGDNQVTIHNGALFLADGVQEKTELKLPLGWQAMAVALNEYFSDGNVAYQSAPQLQALPQLLGTILVAEDNSVNQRYVQIMCDRLGVQCDCVGDGKEAVSAIKRRSYDLVLMDCRMPHMDGYQATRAIRTLPNGTTVPIIAMTASAVEVSASVVRRPE